MHKRPALRFPAEPFINALCFAKPPLRGYCIYFAGELDSPYVRVKTNGCFRAKPASPCASFSCRTCKMRPCCHDRIRFLLAMIYTDRTLEPLFRKLI